MQPYSPASPNNGLSGANLALEPGTRAISKSTRLGSLCGLNCSDQLNSGILTRSEDDYDEESKTTDWWGYVWPRPYNMNHIVYETGDIFPDGGWYAGDLHVQVRQNFHWIDVPGHVTISPAYPYSNQVRAQAAYTFSFPNTCGDGVRIIGTPGGKSHFTSISQLGVYFGGGLLSAVPSSSCNVVRLLPSHPIQERSTTQN